MTDQEYRVVFGEDKAAASKMLDRLVAESSDATPTLAGRLAPQDQPGAARKFDAGKTNWHLLPMDALEEIAKVLEFGAGKYDAWNWADGGGFKYSRLFNSSMRHLVAWFWRREDLDSETGISHLAHLGCNVLFLLHYVLNKNKFSSNDDRR